MKTVATEPDKNLQATVPAQLLQRAQEAAQVNQLTLDEFATEALQKHLARQTLQRFHRAAQIRRDGMSDADIEHAVDNIIHEYRQEERDRLNSKPGH